VEKRARIFESLAEADAAKVELYAQMSPSERLSVFNQLLADAYGTEPRLERVLRVLDESGRTIFDSRSGGPGGLRNPSDDGQR
jgi:hypothetical protein